MSTHEHHRLSADPADSATIPLCVDLDGTLITSDVLVEGFLRCLKLSPLNALLVPLWMLRGKAFLKAQIARLVSLDVGLLPANEKFLEWLLSQRAEGRLLILCTAANQAEANRVAAHYGIFDSVISSDDKRNLSGATKAAALVEKFGEHGFDYAGNELKDIHVWNKARRAVVVAPDASLRLQLDSIPRVEKVFPEEPRKYSVWMRALRLHQWSKNVLIFIPLLTSHRVLEIEAVIHTLLAFLWFGLCASGTYLLNDLMDLDADRQHARKRRRPLASGHLPLVHGIIGAIALIALAVTGAWLTLGMRFTPVLLLYLGATLWYSLELKRIAMVDALTLAGLYTLRVLAGGAAIAAAPSFWLLAFSMFMFLSLAMVKRFTELRTVLVAGKSQAAGRGYTTDDLPLLLCSGISSGFMCVLVLALYINSAAESHYQSPHALWLLCPLLLYWICRVWRKAHRGELHDDPVVFALRDKPSIVVAVLCAVLMTFATQVGSGLLW